MDHEISNEVANVRLALAKTDELFEVLDKRYEVWEISIAEYRYIEEAKELIDKACKNLWKAESMIHKFEVEYENS